MAFLFDLTERDPKSIDAQFRAYYQYLESVKESLPSDAFTFASAPWHYDPMDHRCPHDAWVESLTIKEPSSGSGHEYRSVELLLRLLGAYHDGHIEIVYSGVKNYSLTTPAEPEYPRPNVGHGDWLVDEVRLSERGLVEHEIRFSQGGRWLIECKDVTYQWIPFSQEQHH